MEYSRFYKRYGKFSKRVRKRFKKITKLLDDKITLYQAIGEPFGKNLDIAIKLSVAYEKLQQENKKLNGAIQTYDILLKSNVEENKKLKKQLEECKLQNINLRADIMIKKMALPNELIKDKTFYNLYDMPTYEELLAQQKEFIKYLEGEIKTTQIKWGDKLTENGYIDIAMTVRAYQIILQKYTEIIGSDSNE